MPKRSPTLHDTPVDAGRVSQCTIILVHGTRGFGFFPKRREVSLYPPNKRWWFEEGSQFRTGLDEALKSASLDWPIRPFLWSGANSVHARDCAARELSDQLTKDLQGDPDARAVIIAHSHGGNVALRALQLLNSMPDKIRVVTLATPFLRVFARRSLQLPAFLKFVLFYAIWLILFASELIASFLILFLSDLIAPARVWLPHIVASWYFLLPVLVIVLELLAAVGAGIFITQWLIAILSNTQAALAIEEEASYDTKGAAASRMLVIRGVDDEASLSLAAGSIGSRLSYLVLVGVIPAIFLMSALVMNFIIVFSLFFPRDDWLVWPLLVSVGAAIFALIFLIIPGVVGSVFFGREFLINALVCDVAVDSVPDTQGQVEAITFKTVEAASSEPGWISFWFGLELKWPYRSSERLFSLRWWSEMMRIWWRGSPTGDFFKLKGHARLNKSSWQLRHGIYNHPHCVDEIVRWLRRVA